MKQLPALEEILEKVKSAPELELVDPVEVASKELFSKIAVSKGISLNSLLIIIIILAQVTNYEI